MSLMSKIEYLIVPKGTKFTGSGNLGLKEIYIIWFFIYLFNLFIFLKLFSTIDDFGFKRELAFFS